MHGSRGHCELTQSGRTTCGTVHVEECPACAAVVEMSAKPLHGARGVGPAAGNLQGSCRY